MSSCRATNANAILIELNPAYAEMARELVGGAA